MSGSIYLIPTPISESGFDQLAIKSKELIAKLNFYFVENQKNARRFIKKINPDANIDSIEFVDIGKYSEKEEIIKGLEKVWMGNDAGVLSDAGLPGVGDPGHVLILEAQNSGVQIKPLAGPNSFLMALMASGLNGQQFRFHGYLPIDKSDRKNKIREMANDTLRTGESQIFMDTPYRNQQVLEDLTEACPPQVYLCVAINISGDSESILTLPISDWRKMRKKLDKEPAVFILGFKN